MASGLQQVLKNLLSNAFKFTHRGTVSLGVRPVHDGWSSDNDALNSADAVLAFSVTDTGIGIPPDKQQSIFEAFQQADGSTSRKYGGTGLGLAISRELARLLGGEIRLMSMPGAGSTFTLYLPLTYVMHKPLRRIPMAEPVVRRTARRRNLLPWREWKSPVTFNEFDDDRDLIQPDDRVILVVENDAPFVQLMLDSVREAGMKGLATSRGAVALSLAREYPVCAVTLDICLPDIQGWRVLRKLKQDLDTRHIPVYIVSTEDDQERARSLGAIGSVLKPIQSKETIDKLIGEIRRFVERPVKDLVSGTIGPAATRTYTKFDWKRRRAVDGNRRKARKPCDCWRNVRSIVSSWMVQRADLSVDLLIDKISDNGTDQIPLVMYSDEPLLLDDAMTNRLSRFASIRHVQSPERLLDEISLLLHRPVAKLGGAAAPHVGKAA